MVCKRSDINKTLMYIKKTTETAENTVPVIVFILYDRALQAAELIDAAVGVGLARTKCR
jgi:hypothetical protein